MFLTTTWKDFEVLDTGDGEKLERWGDVILRRPDPQTMCAPPGSSIRDCSRNRPRIGSGWRRRFGKAAAET